MGAVVETGPFHDLDEKSLAVVVRAGDFRCAIEAPLIERLLPDPVPEGGAEGRRRVRLSRVLNLDDEQAPAAWVRLRGHLPLVGVDAVETVQDVRDAPFYALPGLTRLERPAFRGVWALEDGTLLPCLDVRGMMVGVKAEVFDD